jgi:tRNA modification GTPase
LLGDKARHWRAQIIEASALIEVGIDFSDEGDVSAELIAPALGKIRVLLGEIEQVLAAQGKSERLRDGLVVAIAGPPNVGKSTLINLLARREVAIVSPHAGTTRDIIEVQLDLDGYPVTLIDTAGVRETDDPVEQEGVRRARARAGEADLVLWLVDAEHDGARADGAGPMWVVRNKIDLDAGEPAVSGKAAGSDFRISAGQGDGIVELMAALLVFAQDSLGAGEDALIGRQRQRELLEQTCGALHRSITTIASGEELAAEDLRMAAYCLGRLLGRVDVEDILDVIFRDFCIGK